jgi:uncharacterized protein YcfJ
MSRPSQTRTVRDVLMLGHAPTVSLENLRHAVLGTGMPAAIVGRALCHGQGSTYLVVIGLLAANMQGDEKRLFDSGHANYTLILEVKADCKLSAKELFARVK